MKKSKNILMLFAFVLMCVLLVGCKKTTKKPTSTPTQGTEVTQPTQGTTASTQGSSSTQTPTQGSSSTQTPTQPTNPIGPTKLDTPTGFVFDSANDTVSFTAVSNSDGYEVLVYKTSDLEHAVLSNDDLVNPEFSVAALPSGTYTVKVKAFAEENSTEYADSDVASYNFEISNLGALYAPTNLRIKDGYILWDCESNSEYEVVVTKKGETTPINLNVDPEQKSFMVAGLEIENGDYTFKVRSVSNRHTTTESEYESYDFTYKVAKEFNAQQIATFTGAANSDNTGGEHAAVELVGDYAVERPTADGWGRIASESFNINFDQLPVVVFNMGTIIGGFHCQLTWNSTLYIVLSDTMKQGNIVKPLYGIKTEGGQPITASGIQSVVLRLGVSNSTTTTANDARAYYKGVKVVYVSEYQEVTHDPEQISAPQNLEVNDTGKIKWDGCLNATHYQVNVITRVGLEPVETKEIEGTYLDVTSYTPGEYTIKVKAINKEDETYTDSNVVEYSFVVQKIVSYTAQEISEFERGGGEIEMGYDSDNELAIYNPNGTAGWGWAWPQTGVDLDLTKNPLVLVYLSSVTEGGYLARAKYTGHGDIIMKNDTAGAITSPTIILMRAAVNVDGNPIGSGMIEGYKFGFGVRGNGEAKVSKIEIITVNRYVDPATEPVKLGTPGNLAINNNGQIAWSIVENANKYQVKVEKLSDNSEVFNSAIGQANFNAAGLLRAGDYKITVKAINDENELMLDSDEAFYTFTVEEVISYAPSQIVEFVHAAGDQFTITLDGDGNAVYNADGTAGWGWAFPANGVDLDLTANPLVVVDLVSTNAGGYLARATYTGSNTIVMINDTTGPAQNVVLVLRAAVNVDGNPITDGTSVEGYKFGFGLRGNGVSAVSNIRIVTISTYKQSLDAPTLSLNNAQVTWDAVENASGYEVKVLDSTDNVVLTSTVTNTGYAGYATLTTGTYKVEVVAKSNSELFKNSVKSVIHLNLTSYASYDVTDMASFVKGGGDDMTNTIDNENGYLIINDGGTAGWGWSWDSTGVDLDLSLNPYVVVDLAYANEGGYLARAKYTGYSGDIVMKNDTPGPHGAQFISMAVSKNVDGNPITNETLVEGYKFGFGVRGNGILNVRSISIISVTVLE